MLEDPGEKHTLHITQMVTYNTRVFYDQSFVFWPQKKCTEFPIVSVLHRLGLFKVRCKEKAFF